MNKKLYISSKAFWDVDFDKLINQAEQFPDFIIRKVFEYGTFDDVINLMEWKELELFRLVGGTGLSLQLGHRQSIDIDLFSDLKHLTETIK